MTAALEPGTGKQKTETAIMGSKISGGGVQVPEVPEVPGGTSRRPVPGRRGALGARLLANAPSNPAAEPTKNGGRLAVTLFKKVYFIIYILWNSRFFV